MAINKLFIAAVSVLLLGACAQDRGQEPQDIETFMRTQGYQVVALNKLPTGHETIEVEINGQTGLFILDTGAGASIIHKDILEKYVSDGSDASATDKGVGAGGATELTRHSIESFSVDGAEYPLVEIASMDLGHVVDALSQAANVSVEGVIGQDLLTEHNGIIDVSKSRLFLKRDRQVQP